MAQRYDFLVQNCYSACGLWVVGIKTKYASFFHLIFVEKFFSPSIHKSMKKAINRA